MRSTSRTRFLPMVIFPAILPGILMPIMVRRHLPDFAVGAVLGVSIGLAILALAWMIKGSRCSNDT